ncbi:MAG TPA: sugar-binding domain-containing protein [Spirochaetia bacterium]|nr:sugar-binding domain-containing protein [Spirochaetia bacterium]
MEDVQQVVNVARMYYLRGMKQEEIAKKLKVSRASISLILTEAKRKGIVEITIHNPMENDDEISRTLAAQFGIRRCMVVPTSIRETDVLIELTAARAADIFDEEAQSGDRVGIAWGRTCYAFMSSYQPKHHFQGIEVIPLVGGSNRNLKRYQLNEMVRQFSEKIKGTPAFIHAPAFPSSQKDFELYMNSSSVRQMMNLWSRIDIAVVSVGAPPITREFDGSKIAARRRKFTDPARMPVGDICGRYFDITGTFVEDPDYTRIIGIPVDSLRKIDKVIFVVGGTEKAYPLLGALKTGLVKTLVTDSQTAMAVLRAREEEKAGVVTRSIQRLFRTAAR